MSAWVTWHKAKPKREPYVRDTRPYARTASHIRGRVYRMGHRNTLGEWMWGMEVINTNSGRVIASDNCAVYQKVVDLCDEATAAARAAWFWDFNRKVTK